MFNNHRSAAGGRREERTVSKPADLLNTALVLLAEGRSVLPLSSGGQYDKKPHYVLVRTGFSTERDGKTAPSWKPLQQERATPEQVRTWFSRPDGKALGMVTGAISSIVVLDFDGEDGARLLEELGLEPHVRTGSGGFHVYFQHPGHAVQTLNSKAKHELGRQWPGLDIRADGGYVMVPPSSNAKGPYTLLRPLSELEDVSVLPQELSAFLGLVEVPAPPMPPAPPRRPLAGPASADGRVTTDYLLNRALEQVTQGDGRNNSGMWLATQLRDNGYSSGEAQSVMTTYTQQVPGSNTKGHSESYSVSEALSTLSSAYSQPAREPWTRRERPGAVADIQNGQVMAMAPVPTTPASAFITPESELHGTGEVFVLPANLKAELQAALTESERPWTLRTPEELSADFLKRLRRDGRAMFAVTPTPALQQTLSRAGVMWEALDAPPPGEPEAVLRVLETWAEDVVSQHMAGDTPYLTDDFLKLLDQRSARQGALYPTNFPPLDAALGGGLFPGLHVMGGVTGGGKTALALHIAEQNARAGRPVLFITYEQSRAELWTRLISPHVGVGLSRFRAGKDEDGALSDHLRKSGKYEEFVQSVGQHLRVREGDGADGAQQWGVERIAAEVRRLRQVYGQSPLVILDYLQRMPADTDNEKRHQIDRVVQSLQVRLGREEETPILLLSSVSRGNYGELLSKPLDERLSVFKESGGIEYTAYSAVLIYPLSAPNASELGYPPAPVAGSPMTRMGGMWRYLVLDLVKNREGEAGLQLAVKWWPATARYEVVGAINGQSLKSAMLVGLQRSQRER